MRLLNGIGLGTFPFANPFSPVDEASASRIVATYLDNGGRHIDTSPTYGTGKVETLLGKILGGFPRSKYTVNSSCGYVLDENGKFKPGGKYKDVIADCEASLRRLRLDVLDSFISHIPDPSTPFEETIGAMVDLRNQGKIQNIGVSNVTLEQLVEYNKTGAVRYVQNRFSLLNQSVGPDLIGYCEEHGIGIVAFQVIERGLLTDGAASLVLRDGDHRTKKSEFVPVVRGEITSWVEGSLRPIARDADVPVSSLAIWWALQQPCIALCQCGATSEAQAGAILRAITMQPPSGTIDRINNAYTVLSRRIEGEYGKTVREFMGLAHSVR